MAEIKINSAGLCFLDKLEKLLVSPLAKHLYDEPKNTLKTLETNVDY